MDPEQIDLTPEQGTEQVQQEPITPQKPIEPTSPEPAAPALTPEEITALIEDRDTWKTKATAQGQENIVLHGQIQERDARKELTNEPTDSDLQAAFPDVDWAGADSFTKSLARKTLSAELKATTVLQKEQERESAARWNTDLELAIASNPTLQGKEQAFKAFASKPTHKGAPLPTLVSAFLFEATATPSNPTPKAPGLLPGNGGPRGPEKTKLMSGSDLKTLRETDYKKYKEYIDTHDTSELDV